LRLAASASTVSDWSSSVNCFSSAGVRLSSSFSASSWRSTSGSLPTRASCILAWTSKRVGIDGGPFLPRLLIELADHKLQNALDEAGKNVLLHDLLPVVAQHLPQ